MLVTATTADGHRQKRQGVQCWLLIDLFDSEDIRAWKESEPRGIPKMLRGKSLECSGCIMSSLPWSRVVVIALVHKLF